MSEETTPTKVVLALREKDFDQHYVEGQQVRLVTGSAAELTEDGRAVLLYLDDNHRADSPMVYALSVPDALHLSKGLRRAVKEYLRGPETK